MKIMSRDDLEELICGRKNALKEIIKAVRKMGGTKNKPDFWPNSHL